MDRPLPGRHHSAHPYRQEDRVRAIRIIADLPVADVEAAKGFYTDYLGLRTEEFNLGWVARYTSPDTGALVQLVTRDAAAPEDPAISVQTDDVERAYAEAQELGYEIVHPLTTEPWGVRRFFVRAPDGTVVNVVRHRA
jgi:catechol 2,3-dioxygenase-like lactoylglutathione lyase family enzyme